MSGGGGECVPAEAGANLLIVDDHAAVRAGLVALLEDEHALTLLPSAAGANEALMLSRRRAPDIALLDIALDDGDGLRLSLDLKRLPEPPAVLLYTASVDPLLAFKARLVGADGLLAKTARAGELKEAIGAVLRGELRVPAFDRELLRAKTRDLSPELLAVIGLRLHSTPVDGMAAALGLSEEEVSERIERVLEILDGDPAKNQDGSAAE